MKNKSVRPPALLPQFNEDDIRSYAYEIYAQGDGAHGHDLAHWFEASAYLQAQELKSQPGAARN